MYFMISHLVEEMLDIPQYEYFKLQGLLASFQISK